MNSKKMVLLDRIVNALLYEGYILYPYRPSSKKNQRERFTFGRVYPKAYSENQMGADPFSMRTQCLVRGASPTVKTSIRFLQPIRRESEDWLDALEREVVAPNRSVNHPPIRIPFDFDSLEGDLEFYSEPIDDSVSRVTILIENLSPMDPLALSDRSELLLKTFVSTHTIIEAQDGEFLSLLDPPAEYRTAAEECRNIGTWPVLVGDESLGEANTMLSSPIILYDYPRVASESPGDWCDGTEIDEMLALRVLTLTDAEKTEMSQADAFACRILERAKEMTDEDFMKLHGTLRDPQSFDDRVFGSNARLESVATGGTRLATGDTVRIRPSVRVDVMDIVLADKTAVIEAIEQDAEGKIHLALVLNDDPGKDLGLQRQVGHRFFYGLDEIEPLGEDES